MSGYRPARGGVLETMADFYKRRQRELANFGQEAEASAHKAYGEAIRSGRDLVLRTQGEVNRFGASLIGDGKPGAQGQSGRALSPPRNSDVVRPAVVGSQPPRPGLGAGRRQTQGDLDRNPVAKAVAGDLAQRVGNAAGVVRGGVHTVEGLFDGAVFLGRLTSPVDLLLSPPGESATAQLAGAASRGMDYVRKGVADPQSVARDVRAKTHQMRVDLDPSATPVAPTVGEEVRRRLNVGMNQGELAVDIGSFAVGGPLAKSVKGLGAVSKAAKVEKYVAQGFSPAGAAYLAEPYPVRGMGHHFIPRSYRLPTILGGGPLPRAYSDGLFNRLAPEGMTRGDFYERHFRVDPAFHGGKLPARVGGERWSGNALGLEKYSMPGRLWYGSPAPLKARVGGTASGVGGLVYDASDEEE